MGKESAKSISPSYIYTIVTNQKAVKNVLYLKGTMKKGLFILLFFLGFAASGLKAQCNAFYTYVVDSSNPLTVNFSDSSSAARGVASWLWDFGDSDTSTLQHPQHTYLQAGTYITCLTVADTMGCFDSFCDTIVVTSLPTPCNVLFTFNDSIVDDTCGKTDASISILNLSGGLSPYAYSWSNGDSASSIVNILAGIYTLTITDADGCDSISSFTVSNIVNPNFTYVDSNGVVDFTSTSTGSTYLWDFGDGDTSNLSNPSHTFAQVGKYQVCLTITDSNNVPCTFCDSVSINEIVVPCMAGFTYVENANNLVTFTNTSTPVIGSTFKWDFGDGDTSSAVNVNHTYNIAGVYVVILDVEDSNKTACSFSDTIFIELSLPCEADFDFAVNQDSVFFQDNAFNYTEIKYFFGDGDSSDQANPTHVYAQNGTYVVCQRITNSNTACQDEFCDTVEINIPPPCKAGFSYTIIEDTVVLQNEASNYSRLSYEFGDDNGSNEENPKHVYSQKGIYVIKQKVYNDITLCVDSIMDTIEISFPSLCVALYEQAVDTTLRNNLFLLNRSSKFNTHDYAWTFGDGNMANGRTPTHRYTAFGDYEVCLTVNDDSIKCSATFCDSISVTANSSTLLKVIDEIVRDKPKGNLFENLNVFPNPFSEQIIISIENISEELNYTIYDYSGLPRKEGKINQMESIIELKHLKSGIYLLLLEGERDSELRKIVKR